MDIPGASQHREADKVGYLTKLSGRSFPYIPQWKRRYCVLSRGRLYYYEREDSKPGEKSNGVINLEYFDQVTEAGAKECKKATNVFIITSQDRSFFDPGRHLFSADTLPDMKDWVRKLQSALEQIRNNNRSATSTTSSKKESGKKGKEESLENKENKENAQNSTKDRKKKKDSHRPRKSARVGDGSETPNQGGEEASTPLTSHREATGRPKMSSTVGIQLPGMTSPVGVKLPGMSSKRESLPVEPEEDVPTSADANPLNADDGLPAAGPTLTCVTKQRAKGPHGRRAPQNRRTMAAASLKKHSSLSALEYQDLNDNRSESKQGTRDSGRDSGRHSKTPENDLEVVEEIPSMRETIFEDIDKDLFFSKMQDTEREGDLDQTKSVKEGETKVEEVKRSSKTNSHSGEKGIRRPRSGNGTLVGRFRATMVSMKKSKFESKEPIRPDHPDCVDNSSRWGCTIL